MTVDDTFCGGTLEAFINGGWVDLSDRIDLAENPIASWHGRQTVLTDPDGSSLTFTLRDEDRALMPDNTSSPYYPDWDQGCPIRWTEVADGNTVYNFVGYIEQPQTAVATDEADGGDAFRQVCVVSCIDVVTWLDRGKPFNSTLTAHILEAGGTALKAYWPMTEAGGLKNVAHGPTQPPIEWEQFLIPNTAPSIEFGGATVVPADDSSGVQINNVYESGIITAGYNGRVTFTTPISVGTSDVVTIACWLNLANNLNSIEPFFIGGSDLTANGESWTLDQSDVGVSQSINIIPTMGEPVFVAMRTDFAAGTCSLYVNGSLVQTFTGSAAAATTINAVFAGSILGGMGHLQIYVGSSSAYPTSALLAQATMGHDAQDRQTVPARIEMIRDMAGIDPALMSIDQTSPTVMQSAAIGGQSPGAAIRDAVAADQGVWFGSPDGLATFQSRRVRYYDAAVAGIAIPYTLIAQPLQFRRDNPINNATITIAGSSSAIVGGGGAGYAEDAASVAARGSLPFAAALLSDVNADAQAYADFLVNSYTEPKTRILELTFNLDGLDEADKHTVLTLEIGDHIHITGAPAGWPTPLTHMSVEGRSRVTQGQNQLTLTCAAVLGSASGAASPVWFVVGSSSVGGTHVVAF